MGEGTKGERGDEGEGEKGGKERVNVKRNKVKRGGRTVGWQAGRKDGEEGGMEERREE